MIAVVDFGAGNLRSVVNALAFLGEDAVQTRDKTEILAADKVILPGVGSFGNAMDQLDKRGLVQTIYDVHAMGKPFLGICLGLQLLFEESEESPGVKGLGIFKGKIHRFIQMADEKIPQIGWNTLQIKKGSKLFQGFEDREPYVYFVHSYYLMAEHPEIAACTTDYADAVFHSSIEHGNTFACQFHPEKSGVVGLKMLKNFCSL